MSEKQFIGKLKEKAVEDDWNKIQGKGDSSENNQDLLSHSLDVVQITHNILDSLDLESDYSERDFLSAAFLHDLHKLEELGGTNSLEKEEVEEVLENWEVRDEILESFSLQEFTDVLKSIHQYTGSNESRTRVNNDTQLQRLAYVIRLADGIASTIKFSDLYEAGKLRKNREVVERLNQAIEQKYMLGYHQLSEVKPALGNLIHDAVREAVKDRDGIPVASRKDGTVYLLPENFEEENITEEITAYSQEKFDSFRLDVPKKVVVDAFRNNRAVDIFAEKAINQIEREGGQENLFDSYSGTVDALAGTDSDNWELVQEGEELVNWDEDERKIITSVPSTQKGYIIGDFLSEISKRFNSDNNSRIEIAEKGLENILEMDLSDFKELSGRQWRAKQSHIPRIIGNYAHQRTDQSATDTIEKIQENTKNAIPNSDGALSEIEKYIEEILTIDSRKKVICKPKFSPEIEIRKSYEEVCISCGQEGELKFRTTQTSPYSKSYMARGLAGEATSDDWEPKLCTSCFLDQTLMRALVGSENSYISDMQNTIFLKIYPSRYLGTKQAKILKKRLEDYSSAWSDSRDYLEDEQWDEESKFDQLIEDEDYDEFNMDQTVSIGSMSGLISSENYFLLAVEDTIDDDSGAEKQVTKNWLNAVQRGLLFRYRYNLDVEISNNAEISIDKPYPDTSGVALESPPSQISAVFNHAIEFDEVEENLTGLANLVYSTKYDRAESSNDLNSVYSEFKKSLYPGSRIYRAVERGDGGDSHISDVCNAINLWKSYTTGASNMNRLQNTVDSFKISAKSSSSTYQIQSPVRTLINNILKGENESREEILDQASGSIYRRVDRKWNDDPDVYFGPDSDEDVKDLIYDGCVAFYDDIFQEMLNGDKIKLANQKNDILDGFYFIVITKGVSE